MQAVIVEDEAVAVKNLRAILREVAPDINVIAVLDSIRSAVNYFSRNEMPDLVFMDIQLADGESFAIFRETGIGCPVIFTTAYDSYALEAFKVNSIDYLLKPIEPGDVFRALNKLRNFSNTERDDYSRRMNSAFSDPPRYMRTLLVGYRDKLIPVRVNQIAFFHTENERVILTTFEGKSRAVDFSLDALMLKLNPGDFFRANRQYIISHRAVNEASIWFGSRLSVNLIPGPDERIIISKARVAAFKKWLTRN